jgi:TetR/AcrR family transcriptional regulator, acrEF/envCD operon repressor
MAKRTKAEALKTRQELIETAIAQFAQHGVSKEICIRKTPPAT